MDILDIAIAKQLAGGGGGSGTDNYNDLSNLPKINDVTLSGNKTSANLGLQSEINSDSKLASDLIDDTNQDNKFVTSTEKNTWNAKQNAIDADHKLNADYVDDSTSTNKFVTASDKEAWNAKQNAIDNSHKLSSDLVDDANHTNKFVTSTEKNTWNGKQNAIDSEHKLSSSLVSFTTAEAAALASGIDSTKVAQISTNQSNILYALETGANNLLDLSNATMVADPSLTVTKDGNSYVVSGNPSTTVQVTFTDFVPCVPITGGKIAVVGCPSGGSTQNGYSLRGYLDSSWKCTDFGSDTKEFTTSSINKIVLYFVGGHQYTNVRFTPMVVSEEVWNTLGSDYRPPALPNYDLTYLEAQDRAALAEEIDAGAKSLVPMIWTNADPFADIHMTKNSDGSITVTATNTAATRIVSLSTNINNYLTVGKRYVLSGCDGGDYSNHYGFALSTSDYTGRVFEANGSEEFTYASEVVNFTLVVRAGESWTKTFKPMICTKAAFGVSNKFVPYRPNYDLVAKLVPIYKSENINTTTAYTLANIYATVPPKSIVRITGRLGFGNSVPKGVILSDSNSSSDFDSNTKMVSVPVEASDDNAPSLHNSALCTNTTNTPHNVYLWVKSGSDNKTNSVRLITEWLGDA